LMNGQIVKECIGRGVGKGLRVDPESIR
jgi:hypothetical protein